MSTMGNAPTRKSRGGKERAGAERALAFTVVHSPDAGVVGLPQTLEQTTIIGRSADEPRAIVIKDRELSRKHAEIARSTDGWSITDTDSTNGLRVDGVETKRATVHDGTVVRAGDSVLVFHVAATDAALAGDFVGTAAVLIDVLGRLDRAATTDLPILVIGETGTGKELAAARVHARSGKAGAFVAVNCAAISADLIESQLFGHKKGAFTGADRDSGGFFSAADGGSLFLDEIGEMPLHLQPKLLRALENREFVPVGSTQAQRSSARIIAATNADLQLAIDAGTFRRDLYARVAGEVISLPPLRERRIDVIPLFRHFTGLSAAATSERWSAGFVEALLLHRWPMNVRELRTAAQRHLLRSGEGSSGGDAAEVLLLPALPAAGRNKDPDVAELTQLLERYAGNVSELARHYGKNPRQIYRWLDRHGLDPERFRR
jgi:DNA-binding NtrC family response regulator